MTYQVRRFKRQTSSERRARRGLRDRLFRQHAGLCALCGNPMVHTLNRSQVAAHTLATFDHIKPLALGGDHSDSNYRLVHAGCNAVRGHHDIVAIPLVRCP